MLTRDKVGELSLLYWGCDSTRTRQELGWAPQIDFAEGTASTVAWYREAGWL